MAQPEVTFVFLFLVELALLFLYLVVFDSPGFHCFLQTSLHFLPRWLPFSFFINHLIPKSYRFPFKAQSHSNFLHHLHWFQNDCFLILDRLSSPCSFNPLTSRLGHVAGNTQSCLLVRIPQQLQSSSTSLFKYNLSSLSCFPNMFFPWSCLLIISSSSFSSLTLSCRCSLRWLQPV